MIFFKLRNIKLKCMQKWCTKISCWKMKIKYKIFMPRNLPSTTWSCNLLNNLYPHPFFFSFQVKVLEVVHSGSQTPTYQNNTITKHNRQKYLCAELYILDFSWNINLSAWIPKRVQIKNMRETWNMTVLKVHNYEYQL